MSEPKVKLATLSDLKLYYPVQNKEWVNAYFALLRFEGYYPLYQIEKLEKELRDNMPEDEGWNAFEKASAEDVQQSGTFPDVCREWVAAKGVMFSCRKTHVSGDNEHEVMMNDETGQHQIRITWR